jgi:hypothetical protein
MKRSIVVAAVAVVICLMFVGTKKVVADGNPMPSFPPKSPSDVSSTGVLLRDGNPLPPLMQADGDPLPPFPPCQKPSVIA